jgi:hypothetical protein
VLDTMDMSNHADCSSPEDAAAFVAAHPLDDFPQMALGHGMANGGIGRAQLAWLKHTLEGARRTPDAFSRLEGSMRMLR